MSKKYQHTCLQIDSYFGIQGKGEECFNDVFGRILGEFDAGNEDSLNLPPVPNPNSSNPTFRIFVEGYRIIFEVIDNPHKILFIIKIE